MFTTIIGIIWIILGLWLLSRPERVTRRIEKKGRKAFTKVLLIVGLTLIGALCSFAFDHAGWLPKLIALAGTIVVVKLFFMARAKFGQHLVKHADRLKTKHLRMIAAGYLILGIGLISMNRVSDVLGIGQNDNSPEQMDPANPNGDGQEQPEEKKNNETDRLPRSLRNR